MGGKPLKLADFLGRFLLHLVALITQISLIFLAIIGCYLFFSFFSETMAVITFLVILSILNGHEDQSYQISWLLLLVLFPVFGCFIYLWFRRQPQNHPMDQIQRRYTSILNEYCHNHYLADHSYREDGLPQLRYLENYSSAPCYPNTITHYHSSGEASFYAMLSQLRSAKHFIFLEYFIISRGVIWQSILDILSFKSKNGVEIKLIYDGIGCALTLPMNYDKHLNSLGIPTQVFHPIRPVLTKTLNQRDHRKMMIIDGVTAFTGGINLADEYANLASRPYHWKDGTIELHGEGVQSMTISFLSMWDYCTKGKSLYTKYQPNIIFDYPDVGLVQPYTDTPLTCERVGLTVYFNLITKAKNYIYITTPYLILDQTTTHALCNAAKSGIKVIIITPHIPDKKFVFHLTRAHYPHLIDAGVKIFEYTPGFIHSKLFLVDGRYATVSTVNLDFRSLFLHFENGVWLWNTPSILEIVADFEHTLSLCREITLSSTRSRNPLVPLYRSILRIFAPLM